MSISEADRAASQQQQQQQNLLPNECERSKM